MQLPEFFALLATVLTSDQVPAGQWLIYIPDQGVRTTVTVVRLGRHDFRAHVRDQHFGERQARFTRQLWLRHWLGNRLHHLEPHFEAVRIY